MPDLNEPTSIPVLPYAKPKTLPLFQRFLRNSVLVHSVLLVTWLIAFGCAAWWRHSTLAESHGSTTRLAVDIVALSVWLIGAACSLWQLISLLTLEIRYKETQTGFVAWTVLWISIVVEVAFLMMG